MAILGNTSVTSLDSESIMTQNGGKKVLDESYIPTGSSHTHSISLITSLQSDLNAKAPTNHRSTATTYGIGNSTYYGHVKVETTPTSGSTNAISSGALYTAINNGGFFLPNNKIFFYFCNNSLCYSQFIGDSSHATIYKNVLYVNFYYFRSAAPNGYTAVMSTWPSSYKSASFADKQYNITINNNIDRVQTIPRFIYSRFGSYYYINSSFSFSLSAGEVSEIKENGFNNLSFSNAWY